MSAKNLNSQLLPQKKNLPCQKIGTSRNSKDAQLSPEDNAHIWSTAQSTGVQKFNSSSQCSVSQINKVIMTWMSRIEWFSTQIILSYEPMWVPTVLHLQLGSGGSLAEESLCLRPTPPPPLLLHNTTCTITHLHSAKYTPHFDICISLRV